MSNANDIFLQAIQPVVDIFWTLVWSATGSTLSVPRPVAPTKRPTSPDSTASTGQIQNNAGQIIVVATR